MQNWKPDLRCQECTGAKTGILCNKHRKKYEGY